MKDLNYFMRRIFFLGAFILASLALAEKVVNLIGYTILRGHYTPWRLLEFAAIGLLFLVVLQLREINISLTAKQRKEEPK